MMKRALRSAKSMFHTGTRIKRRAGEVARGVWDGTLSLATSLIQRPDSRRLIFAADKVISFTDPDTKGTSFGSQIITISMVNPTSDPGP